MKEGRNEVHFLGSSSTSRQLATEWFRVQPVLGTFYTRVTWFSQFRVDYYVPFLLQRNGTWLIGWSAQLQTLVIFFLDTHTSFRSFLKSTPLHTVIKQTTICCQHHAGSQPQDYRPHQGQKGRVSAFDLFGIFPSSYRWGRQGECENEDDVPKIVVLSCCDHEKTSDDCVKQWNDRSSFIIWSCLRNIKCLTQIWSNGFHVS